MHRAMPWRPGGEQRRGAGAGVARARWLQIHIAFEHFSGGQMAHDFNRAVRHADLAH